MNLAKGTVPDLLSQVLVETFISVLFPLQPFRLREAMFQLPPGRFERPPAKSAFPLPLKENLPTIYLDQNAIALRPDYPLHWGGG